MEHVCKKVLIVGDANCGKTSLASAFVQNRPWVDEKDEGSLGTVSKIIPVDVDGTEVSLVLTETSGREDGETMRSWKCSDTDVILMCYSIDDPVSYLNTLAKWKPEMEKYFPHVPLVLVGNKSDLRKDEKYVSFITSKNGRILNYRDGIYMVEKMNGAMYIECSAKEDDGVREVFEIAARIAYEKVKSVKKGSSSDSLHSSKTDVSQSISKTILLVGDAKCGKKSLMSVFMENKSLVEHYSNYVKSINTSIPIHIAGTAVSLTLMTISGLEDLDMIRFQTYTSVDAVVICFAIDNYDSLRSTYQKWLPEIKERFSGVPIVLAGTKKDMRRSIYCEEDKGIVKYKDVERMSEKEGVYSYVECSAIENDGVYEVFEAATWAALEIVIDKDPSTSTSKNSRLSKKL